MSWILKLYPRDWRRRYGAEVAEVVASQPSSIQLTVDLLGGAIDAHMKPQASARLPQDADAAKQGEPDMISRLRCSNSISGVSRRDAVDLPARPFVILFLIGLATALVQQRIG